MADYIHHNQHKEHTQAEQTSKDQAPNPIRTASTDTRETTNVFRTRKRGGKKHTRATKELTVFYANVTDMSAKAAAHLGQLADDV